MKSCRPLDLVKIRTSLRYGQITLARMGELIPIYVPGCKYAPTVPETRIWEWEIGKRSVPEYVHYSYAALLVDDWASDRHEVDPMHIPEVDHFYASLLNPGFGELLRTEHQVRQLKDPGLRSLLPNLESMREGWQQHYKEMLGLDMRPIWVEKIEDLFI